MSKIDSLAELFDCSAEQLQELLQNTSDVEGYAHLCYEVGRLVMPDADGLEDEEIVDCFRLVVEKTIEEKRRLENGNDTDDRTKRRF